MHRSALGKCHLPKQPGKKVCALLSAFGFWVLCGLRLGAVRGTFNVKNKPIVLFSQPQACWQVKTPFCAACNVLWCNLASNPEKGCASLLAALFGVCIKQQCNRPLTLRVFVLLCFEVCCKSLALWPCHAKPTHPTPALPRDALWAGPAVRYRHGHSTRGPVAWVWVRTPALQKQGHANTTEVTTHGRVWEASANRHR